MVCRIADVIREPRLYQEDDTEVNIFVEKFRRWTKHYEPQLLPAWKVAIVYDYGFCCGVDSYTWTFATKEDAEKFIEEVKAGNHEWLRYDPEFIEDDDD